MTSEQKKVIGEKIKMIRGPKDRISFAANLNVPPNYLSRYENGKVIPSADFLQSLAQKHNVNINWLLADQGEMYIKDEVDVLREPDVLYSNGKNLKVYLKVSPNVPVGEWINAYTLFCNHPKINSIKETIFGFAISDNSMLPRYLPGDVIICSEVDLRKSKPENNEIVVVVFDKDVPQSEPYIRIIQWLDSEKSRFILKSLNPMSAPRVAEIKEINKIFKFEMSISTNTIKN